jgi:hypothetical protein
MQSAKKYRAIKCKKDSNKALHMPALEEFVFDGQIVVGDAKHGPPIDRRVFDRRRHTPQRRAIYRLFSLPIATAITIITIMIVVILVMSILMTIIIVAIVVKVIVAAARLQCRVRNQQRRRVRVLVEVEFVQQQTNAVLCGDQRRFVTGVCVCEKG